MSTLMWLLIVALLVVGAVASWRITKPTTDEQTQAEAADAAWIHSLATTTPIHDQLAHETFRRELDEYGRDL